MYLNIHVTGNVLLCLQHVMGVRNPEDNLQDDVVMPFIDDKLLPSIRSKETKHT